MATAAIGFSVHTGWAAMVALVGTPPRVLARERIALAEIVETEALQIYHQAAELPLAIASARIDAAIRAAQVAARASLGAALGKLGEPVARGAIVGGNTKLPAVEAILA